MIQAAGEPRLLHTVRGLHPAPVMIKAAGLGCTLRAP